MIRKRFCHTASQATLDLSINLEDPDVRFEVNHHNGGAPTVRSQVIHRYYGKNKITHVQEGTDEALHCSSGALTPEFLNQTLPMLRRLRTILSFSYSAGHPEEEIMAIASMFICSAGWYLPQED